MTIEWIGIVVVALAIMGLALFLVVSLFKPAGCYFCGDRLNDKVTHINSQNERCCLSCSLTDIKS